MAKIKTAFLCQHCGMQSPKWVGRCPACGEWNTYVEERVTARAATVGARPVKAARAVALPEILPQAEERIRFADDELNRVLGGGLVKGSLVLLGGEPGIGKSTLLLQAALDNPAGRTLYVTGEESDQQVRMRADRLKGSGEGCFVLAETAVGAVIDQAARLKPGLVIVDSVQTLHADTVESPAGSVSQIRESAGELLRYAKESGVPVMLIGHITKDGLLAGPKVLEHMVDTVLQFEGDRHHLFRILRCLKNRFGPTSEMGIYTMQQDGMQPVENPSALLITPGDRPYSGVAISATLDGMRPILIEVQALVSSAVYGVPQRSTTGFDLRRLNMLLAVLEKRCGFRLGAKDVFLNIAGGIRVEDPAIDLAVLSAIMSSDHDIALPPGTCFAGEAGLSGEIRPVNRIQQRIDEADRLGFKKLYLSSFNMPSAGKAGSQRLALSDVGHIEELFSELFG